MSKKTPTAHGAWRMIKGQLVDESVTGTAGVAIPVEPVATPLVAHTDVRIGGPGIAVPPADKPNPTGRTRPSKKPPTRNEECADGSA